MTNANHSLPSDEQLTTVLRKSADDIDEVTSAKLQSLRARALGKMGSSQETTWLEGWYVPAGATLAIAVLVASVSINTTGDAYSEADDFELLTETDAIEFYDDWEFYEWLPSVTDTG